jgi:hypothetical protein
MVSPGFRLGYFALQRSGAGLMADWQVKKPLQIRVGQPVAGRGIFVRVERNLNARAQNLSGGAPSLVFDKSTPSD